MNRSVKILAVALAIVMPMALLTTDSDADGTSDSVLIDLGNGTTVWYAIPGASDPVSLGKAAAEANSMDYVESDDGFSMIGGMTEHNVGTQECSWRFYAWTASGWVSTAPSDYTGGTCAWGFYPDDSITPVETPENPAAWTMHRMDSASSGHSDSHGTVDAKAPMEWARTYTTGYVDSAIVAADNYVYHTTGGTYGASGSDRSPWVYCIDRFTGDMVWEFMMSYGQGYEVTSPLIVGDMIIVTSTSGKVYCLDRFTGVQLHTLDVDNTLPLDGNGDVVWDGRVFYTGATTPVYDSGAVYFGTSNGHVMSYSVTREAGFELLWDYDPDDSTSGGEYTGVKGCFYFHAPVITDVDGTRMLFIGSYEGYIHALDAATGEEVYVKRLINLGADNRPHPGTPGSVGGIYALSNGTILADCSDGGMSSLTGYLVCIDAATGMGSDGSEYNWKLDVIAGGVVSDGEHFYAYTTASTGGPSSLPTADGGQVALTDAIYKYDLDGRVVWVSQEYPLVKGALTLADGVVYSNDYSAGKFWPTGGGVTAISTEDGSEVWRLRLSPDSADSYSMVPVTVVDGRIYVGNDYGAIYCISDISGPEYGDSGEIVLENGFHHWSWAVLAVVVIASLIFLARYY